MACSRTKLLSTSALKVASSRVGPGSRVATGGVALLPIGARVREGWLRPGRGTPEPTEQATQPKAWHGPSMPGVATTPSRRLPLVAAARARVDVGIVSWNTRDLTLAAVEHVLQQANEIDLRVLVRDNGSTDGTAEALALRFPDVILDVGDNVGFAAGVNALVRLSQAPWFLTLNSDAWPEAHALHRLVEVGRRHPAAAAIAPLVLRPDGALEHTTHPFPSLRVAALTGLGAQRVIGSASARAMCLPGAWPHDEERQVDWAVGAALLLRRDALDQIGAFDESFFMYAEDLEWGWRAAHAGWETWFTPEAVVRHVGNASGVRRFGSKRDQVAITNANAVVRRYLGGPSAAAWRALNALGAFRMAVRSLRRHNRSTARFWLRQVPAHLGRRPGR